MTAVRHPRRLGFAVFNAIALASAVVALVVAASNAGAGLAGLPNVAMAAAAVIVVTAVWAATWLAWGSMVWSRRRAGR